MILKPVQGPFLNHDGLYLFISVKTIPIVWFEPPALCLKPPIGLYPGCSFYPAAHLFQSSGF